MDSTKRILKVQKCLKKWGIDLLIVEHPIDLFYLTGQELSAGRLVIFENEATLYVDGRYYALCKEKVPLPVILQAKDNFFPVFEGKRIGFDAHITTYETFEKLSALKGELVALPSPMQGIRALKEAEEIEHLCHAAELGSKGFDFVVTQLVEGITEEEIAMRLELFWRKEGGGRLAFAPHIAFGTNSSFPHYHAGERVLKRGDIVLIDIGVVLEHYHSDMTRMIFFGEPDKKLESIYHIVHAAQLKALELCRPKTPIAELDRAARDLIDAQGYGENFLHSLGHGVGLEIHEAPWIRKNETGVLEEGMVVTIEPGIYLPGIGGVRLEDTVVITRDGHANLTNRPIYGKANA